MTPDEFIAKWQGTTLKERSAAQEHFIDLCRLLDEPTPAEADPAGTWYTFEKGASKAGGGDGWADVWKRGCFGWEYKGPKKDLKAAFKQLQLYTPALEYPPLLIVSDLDRVVIHTAFTGTVPEVHVLTLEDLRDSNHRRKLKWAFSEPERLRPGRTTAGLTEEAARRFGELALSLRSRGHDPHAVSHFSIRLLFCLFAEDIDLLPKKMFTQLLDAGLKRPESVTDMLKDLFSAMATGGKIGFESVDWFNGGLFDSPDALPLEVDDIKILRELSALDWSAIEPSILGTLFERGLDPGKRGQLGAHYTDPGSIMRLVNPVVLDPLRDEWERIKANIEAMMVKADEGKSAAARTKATNAAMGLLQGFLDRLRDFRVLDPACGSGNFLLLSLKGLKDLEHQVLLEAEMLGLPRSFPMVGPENVLGIEINVYAAELARVTVWIGEIQWMLSHGFSLSKNPILKPLDTIYQMDAIVNADGTEPEWPATDAIVGNPPFLGDKRMRSGLGDEYVTALRALYQGRVPGGADLVTYWFEKARAEIEAGKFRYAGLVATNSIRGGASRKVLERINDTGAIFHAWSDEPWINEGAAVRVSLVAFTEPSHNRPVELDGLKTQAIHADLTPNETADNDSSSDVTKAHRLQENQGIAFQGPVLIGAFDVDGAQAREWLVAPNPHGRPNREVLRPLTNGRDITSRSRGFWVVDFQSLPASSARLYEEPFEHVRSYVKPLRDSNSRANRRERWWIHGETGSGWRLVIEKLHRYIATSQVAKYRVFVWRPVVVWPHQTVIAIARSDDATFGILSSRFHELWALRMGTSLEDRPRYTPTTTFETFPFPEGLAPADTAGETETLTSGAVVPSVAPEHRSAGEAIAEAAHSLNTLRENWLNPPEWVDRVPEVVPGYPDRIIPKPGHEADLKKRTLTKLYNLRPAWLDHAHRDLDAAVAAAYGWTDYKPEMAEAEILARLLALNQARSSR